MHTSGMIGSISSALKSPFPIEPLLEIDTQKRCSILSLGGSLQQVRTGSIMYSRTENSEKVRVKSEVTLGADKRRRLLSQEDLDLKTLNQKQSINSDSSNIKYQNHLYEKEEPFQEPYSARRSIEEDMEQEDQNLSKKENLIICGTPSNASAGNSLNFFTHTEQSIQHSHVIENQLQQSLSSSKHRIGNQIINYLNGNKDFQQSNNFQNGFHISTQKVMNDENRNQNFNNEGNLNENLPNIHSLNNLNLNSNGMNVNIQANQLSSCGSSLNNLVLPQNSALNIFSGNSGFTFNINSVQEKSIAVSHQNQFDLNMQINDNSNPINEITNETNQDFNKKSSSLKKKKKVNENQNDEDIRPYIIENEGEQDILNNNLTEIDYLQKNQSNPASQSIQNNILVINPINSTISTPQIKQNKTRNSNSKNLFGNLLAIGKAKKKLLSLLRSHKFTLLQGFHFTLIGDLANENYWKQQKIERRFLKLSGDINNSNINDTQSQKEEEEQDNNKFINVFSPDNNMLTLWDGIVLSALLSAIVAFPMQSAFDIDYHSLSTLHSLLCGIVFSLDVLVTFNRGYYDEGKIIIERKKIVSKYSRGKFWLDLLNILAALLFSQIHIVLLLIASLYRLALSSHVWDRIEEDLEIAHKFPTLVQIVDLCMMIFFIAHLSACGFFFISKSDHEKGVNPTWISQQNIENSNWQIQYLYSIYFEFITMTTIGYGDIYPCSSNEKIFVIFMTMISCGVFGYSLNQIGQIFKDISTQLTSFKQTKYDISKYLKSRGITKKVQMKVYKYLEYLNHQENEGYFFVKGEKILHKVSQDLREEVQREYYGKIISSILFFTKNFSRQFLNELALNMKELNVAPGEFLFREGTEETTLYFLNKGFLEISVNSSNTNKVISRIQVIHKLLKLNFFEINYWFQIPTLVGHQEFLSNSVRAYSARSLSISHFIYITRQDFIKVCQKFPLDYVILFHIFSSGSIIILQQETFCVLKDDYLFKSQDRFSICESCNKQGHNILKCDLIFNNISPVRLIKELNQSEYQERKMMIRTTQDVTKRRKLDIVKAELIKFRKDFINKAVKKNKEKNNSDSEDDSFKKQSSVCLTEGKSDRIASPSQLNANMNSNINCTLKTNSKKGNMSLSVGLKDEEDKAFYKKYPKIKYEEGKYLILSSDQISSSDEDDTDGDDNEDDGDARYNDNEDTYGKYEDEELRLQKELDELIDVRKSTFNAQHFDRNTRKRHTSRAPSKFSESALQIPINVSMEPNQLLFSNRHQTSINNSQQTLSQPLISQTTSSISTFPYSQISSLQQQNSSVNTSPQMSASIPLQQQNSQQYHPQPQLPLVSPPSQHPQNANINQLIQNLNNSKSYFENQELNEEGDNNNSHNIKKNTLFLPTVDEASDEQSIEIGSSTIGSSFHSPYKRSRGKEISQKRQQSRKYTGNSISDFKEDLKSIRRNSLRNDSLSTQKFMRESRRMLSQVESVNLLPQMQQSNLTNLLANNYNPQFSQSFSLPRTISKPQNGKGLQLVQMEGQKISRMSYLHNSNTVGASQKAFFLFIVSFDIAKEFKFYYPHNNMSNILKTRAKTLRRKKVKCPKRLGAQKLSGIQKTFTNKKHPSIINFKNENISSTKVQA